MRNREVMIVLNIKKKIKFLFVLAGIIFPFLFCKNTVIVYATEVYENPDTAYRIILEDQADLLSEKEKMQLTEELQEITTYGNAAFVTITQNPYSSTEQFIQNYYQEQFQWESGIVFLIDMDYRKIWIYSNGRIYQTVTKNYANVITDNVYSYASKRQYYQCASKAFSQVVTLLRGEKIAQPMKYICNIFLALVLAFLINYFIVMLYSKSKKPSRAEGLTGIPMQYKMNHPRAQLVRETKRYSPIRTSSGGSGGGRSSGGGGGHSSGGGGGHSF